MTNYEVEAEESVLQEIKDKHVHVDSQVKEAEKYLDQPDVDDIALARMFIEKGFSEPLAYWLVRMAEVRHAPN